jgi:hypothetical protein
MNDNEKLMPGEMSSRELARRCGVCEVWIYQLRKKGVLPSRKVGAHRYFPPEAVDIFFKRAPSTARPPEPTKLPNHLIAEIESLVDRAVAQALSENS